MGNKHDAGIFKRFAIGLALCLSALALTPAAAAGQSDDFGQSQRLPVDADG